MFTIEPLMFDCCLGLSLSNESQWAFILLVGLVSNKDIII